MSDADGGDQGVDGAQLNAMGSTFVAEVGCPDVIPTVGRYESQVGEPLKKQTARGCGECPLQNFLQDDACRHHEFLTRERSLKRGDVGCVGRRTEGKLNATATAAIPMPNEPT